MHDAGFHNVYNLNGGVIDWTNAGLPLVNKLMRVIIIGGVAGGMSAATRLRRLDESAEIIVLEKSGHVSYANCGLPYYVGGVIEEEKDLLVTDSSQPSCTFSFRCSSKYRSSCN